MYESFVKNRTDNASQFDSNIQFYYGLTNLLTEKIAFHLTHAYDTKDL